MIYTLKLQIETHSWLKPKSWFENFYQKQFVMRVTEWIALDVTDSDNHDKHVWELMYPESTRSILHCFFNDFTH